MSALHVVSDSETILRSEFVAQIGPGVDTALVTIVEQQLHAVALQADIAQAHALLRRVDPSAQALRPALRTGTGGAQAGMVDPADRAVRPFENQPAVPGGIAQAQRRGVRPCAISACRATACSCCSTMVTSAVSTPGPICATNSERRIVSLSETT